MARRWRWAVGCVVGGCCWLVGAGCAGPTGGGAALGEVQQGVATYYAATGAGNCSFDPSPADLDVAAINASQYAGSGACGSCVEVTGPKGKVTVRIVDQCPDCEDKQLDLSQEAFAKIAEVSAGRVQVSWQVVSCAVSGNLAYRFKEGSSVDWTAIQVRNHRLPIEKLEREVNGNWVNIPREDYNYFVAEDGVGPGTIQIRVTATNNETVEDTLPQVQQGAVVSGAVQFKEP